MKNITISNFFDRLSRKMISCLLFKDRVSRLGLLNSRSQSHKNILGKKYFNTNVSRFWYEELIPSFRNVASFLLVCFLFFSSQIYGQFADVNPPTGGFAIDGGLRANTPTSPSPFASNQGDWYPGTVAGATGGSVFDNSGNVIAPATTQTSGRASGENYNGNDNIFTNGSKFNDYVSALRWFTNSAPDKNDINNALYHVSRDGSNSQWIFISGDRLSTNGTSYIDFELLQGTVVQNSNGTFTGTPLTTKANGGGRTKDDIIISMEYTNGGTKPVVYIYQWKLSGSTWSYQLITSLTDLATNAFAETNRTAAESNLAYTAFGSTTYQQFAFVEAAVNVTYLISNALDGSSCSSLDIKTLWVKTKASASPTAALKDYITPIPVDLVFGSTDIDPILPKCADDGTAYLLSATPIGGTFSGPGVSLISGSYYFTPANAGGAGDKTITYSSADGTCTTTETIVVKALPTITGTLSVCVGSTTQLTGSATAASSNPWVSASPGVATIDNDGLVTGIAAGTSVITYTNSDGCQKTATVTVNALPTITGTLTICVGSTTQLTGSGSPASSNPWVSASPGVATVSNSGLVTGISAGTAVITYTNSNGCQKTATVTVNANPAAPNITYNAPACDQINFSITITNVTNGAIYTIKDKNGNTIGGLSPASPYTALSSSNITFSNIPAGSGYQVSVSENGCGSSTTSCPSTGKSIDKIASKVTAINDETPKVGFDAFPV
ncbi:MAG TPA: Ig-like domain-containing protein, partial [Flavobacterium sp.]